MNRVAAVLDVVGRRAVSPVVRGELTVDSDFAREFVNWHSDGAASTALSDTDRVIACCRALKLDIVCVQSDAKGDPESVLADIRRYSEEGMFVFWVVNGAFQTAAARREMMTFLMDIARSPGDVGNALRQISGASAATISRGRDAGAHGIIIADDIAYRRSTFMPPDFVAAHLLPVWRTHVSLAKDLGMPVFFHSDGNLNAVLPLITEAGFDGLQCIESAAGMDLAQIAATYGRDLCLMGGMDPALLVPGHVHIDAEPRGDLLRQSVADALSATGDCGFIFGTCSGLHAGMSPERVFSMYSLLSELEMVAPARPPENRAVDEGK